MSKDPEDAVLVQECLQGNPQSFEVLVDRYQHAMYNVALRIVHDLEDAADVTQSAFVKVYENLASFNPRYKFFSWLFRIVVNEALNLLKKRKPYAELEERHLAVESSPDGNLLEEEVQAKVERALMDLKFEYRLVVVLRHFQNLSYEEISYIADVPEKTVKSRLFTARKLLREKLMRQGVELYG
jgi:RNA polymerase sigma-70 factor (ECF subfamily)